ncbi:myotubularin-related protein 10-a, partial [Plakobranchus ocellatus]
TFQSYIDLPEQDEEKTNNEEVEKTASAFFDNLLEPRKLQGETKIAEADKVLMFAPFSDRKQGIIGHLFVTNFKISFVTADKSSYPDGDNNQVVMRSKLLENTDIPLTYVDTIYQVSSGARKRKLIPGNSVSTTTKYLEIYCKDFQVHVFGFKFTSADQNRQITDAIAHFSFPAKDSLLFAHEFGHSGRFDDQPLPQFLHKDDWEKELERLQCQRMWRVADANVGYSMSISLPEYFVAPINILNSDLAKACAQFTDKRLPTWCYTYVNGASLVRMSHVLPESDFKFLEEKMLNAVKQSSGNEKDLLICDLGRMCPSLQDIKNSIEKLKAIVLTDSAKDFYSSDARWLSNLENSHWLQHVAACLNTANHVVNQITRDSQTVVLKEETGCDLSCVISCLAQLQLDTEYRTQSGFQSLVQREWVVMGHPFQQRLGFLQSPEGAESEQAPVFLLFLDCVWQLLQQFPSSFAFTETYLTVLWDTANLGLFDTFLFNNCWHRKKFLSENLKMSVFSLPSAWDWKFQLSEEQILLFNNPLYRLRTSYDLDYVVDSAKTALRNSEEVLKENRYSMLLGRLHSSTDIFGLQEVVLKPEVTAGLIKFWSQCFLRWNIPAQIVGGGNPSQYVQQCILTEEVVCLEHKLSSLTRQLRAQLMQPPQQQQREDKEMTRLLMKMPRPSSGLMFGSTGYRSTSMQLSSMYITSSFPFTLAVSHNTQHALICGPLSQYLKDTAIDHNYMQDEND